MLAFSAVASASASANTLGFKYTGTGANKAKLSGSSGEVSFEDKAGALWECTSSATSGEVSGASGSAKLAGVFVTFSGCKSLGKTCTTAGQASGVMKSAELEGELGYLSETELGHAGLLLKAKSGTVFMSCKAGTVTAEFEGGLIGQIGPVNTPVVAGGKKWITASYSQARGQQALTRFAGGQEHSLLESLGGSPFEGTGVQGENSIQPLEGELEIAETL
jgi:hypothetical protein